MLELQQRINMGEPPLLRAGSQFTRADQPRTVTGHLPRPLGRARPVQGDWYDVCNMQSLPFLDLLKEVRCTAHSELTPPMQAALCQVQLQTQSENVTLIKIPATTPADTLLLLRGWQVNPDGVPPAVCQEEDGSMNLLDVDIWLWIQTIAPSIAPVVLNGCSGRSSRKKVNGRH